MDYFENPEIRNLVGGLMLGVVLSMLLGLMGWLDRRK